MAVLLNLSADKSAVDLHGRAARHLLGSDHAAASGGVDPHGWAILELAREAGS